MNMEAKFNDVSSTDFVLVSPIINTDFVLLIPVVNTSFC